MAFLGHLGERGHDVSDQQTIGTRLERERLAVALEAIEGLGPKRVQSLVDRFQTMWSMRHAQAADIATVAGMTRPLAERVVQQHARAVFLIRPYRDDGFARGAEGAANVRRALRVHRCERRADRISPRGSRTRRGFHGISTRTRRTWARSTRPRSGCRSR